MSSGLVILGFVGQVVWGWFWAWFVVTTVKTAVRSRRPLSIPMARLHT